ncbi:hypoyhetical protein [Bifidobacterium catenulatum subsp. kashiwanohense]|nr:hypoyhetical protein [Bifidobacterium catenulatum subsp. kashiwanohense]
MDVRSTSEAFNMFVDNSPEERMQNHFLYVAGNTVSFRTSYDATIPANTWHVGSVSFPVTTV